MSISNKYKRSQSVGNTRIQRNYKSNLDDLLFFKENFLNKELLMEKKKILKEFNKISKLQFRNESNPDVNNRLLIQANQHDAFMRLKKSLNYNYEYGKRRKEKNKNENYHFISNVLDKEMSMEDESYTDQLYNKRYIAEFLTMFFTTIAIGSSILYNQLNSYTIYQPHNEDILNLAISTSLIIVTISNILFIFCTVNRYLIILELRISDKRYCENRKLFSTNLGFKMLLEIFMSLFHPNILIKEITFTSNNFWDMREVNYYINDYLIIIVLLRSYTIFRFFINLSYYYNSRMNRIAKMLGGKVSVKYAIKCLMMSNPKLLLLISVSIWVSVLSFTVKIIEGPLYYIDKDSNDYSLLQNCIWNIFVTMTSVGYGDYYPKTNIGRLVLILTAISGTILVSLIVNSLQNSFKFDENELRAFEYKERVDMKKLIDKNGWEYFVAGHKYAKTKKLYVYNLANPKLTKNLKQRLKDRLTDLLYKKIRAKKDFKRIIQ